MFLGVALMSICDISREMVDLKDQSPLLILEKPTIIVVVTTKEVNICITTTEILLDLP